MYTKSLIAALVAAPAAVSALGNAIIENKCSSNVYMWSVSSDSVGEMHTIAPGSSYSEPYYSPSSGGVSMKISNEVIGAYSPAAITQFEYTLDGMIWYDISNINGYPFMSSGVTLVPGESSCPTKVCPANIELCGDAYNTPDENDATGACSADSNTSLILCSGGSTSAPVAAAPVAKEKVAAPAAAAPKSVAPAPAPTPVAAKVETPAPIVPAPAPHMTVVPAAIPVVEAAPNAGVFTTFVTQMITIAVRDAAPEPTALPMKRDQASIDMHKRAAHRHHFHRRGADAN